ncbi:MAG TPA: nitroreductase [Chloroflexi bacterium]|nr:nitroreductase [Chloroflexota bacterium]
MKFNTEIQALIRQRYSCRSYAQTQLSIDDLGILRSTADKCQIGPFTNQVRTEIISASQENTAELKRLGTYGFIKNPMGFINISAQDTQRAMVDVGFLIEILILKATDLGIGTCWLGGTFTKSPFARTIELRDGEIIPAVISIGYPLDRQVLMDRISRTYAGSDRRLPWQELFYDGSLNQPLTPHKAGQYQEPLEMVRLAPSASNKQPWRIIHLKDQFHFYLQRTKNYPAPIFNKFLRLADLQSIDMGIAMAHFELSAFEGGISGNWIINDPDLPLDKPGLEYIISWKNKT